MNEQQLNEAVIYMRLPSTPEPRKSDVLWLKIDTHQCLDEFQTLVDLIKPSRASLTVGGVTVVVNVTQRTFKMLSNGSSTSPQR